MSDIKTRFLQVIEDKSINKESFFKKIGMASSNFRSTAKHTALNSNSIANILSEIPELNVEWLITGIGEMYKTASSGQYFAGKSIPLVSIDAIAGNGNTAFSIAEKDIIGRYIIPGLQKADFLIRVNGDSMSPTYNNGDFVSCVVIKEDGFIQWGKPHVLATKAQGVILKRIRKTEDKDVIIAISDNSIYDPFQIKWEEIESIAVVIGGVWIE